MIVIIYLNFFRKVESFLFKVGLINDFNRYFIAKKFDFILLMYVEITLIKSN